MIIDLELRPYFLLRRKFVNPGSALALRKKPSPSPPHCHVTGLGRFSSFPLGAIVSPAL